MTLENHIAHETGSYSKKENPAVLGMSSRIDKPSKDLAVLIKLALI